MKYSVYGDSFAVISLAFFTLLFDISLSLCAVYVFLSSTLYSPSGYYFIFGVDLLEIVTSFMANGYGSHDKIGRVCRTVATIRQRQSEKRKNDAI